MIQVNGRQLWRAVYVRNGKGCGVTFSAADLVSAQEFVDRWEATAKVDVLTYKPIGASKIPAAAWRRLG